MELPSLSGPFGPGTAAAENLVEELRVLAREREQQATDLWRAIGNVGSADLSESLHAVVNPLPLVVDTDCASLRLRDQDDLLHLVAVSGCSASETRMRALQPVDVRVAMRLADPATLLRHAEAQGFRWVRLTWLGVREPLGLLLLASRTDRRPQSLQIEVLDHVAAELGQRLMVVHRRAARVRACALQLARSFEPRGQGDAAPDEVAALRPRERSILELYGDGMSTKEIAAMLVISQHTVRTHVKTALRTLGLHSREDAARLVRSQQLALLL